MRFYLAPFLTSMIYPAIVSASPPTFTTQPLAPTGTPTEGQMLTAIPGIVANGTITLIQWQSSGQDIAGATGTTYQARPVDSSVGFRVVALGGNLGETVDAFSPTINIAPAVNSLCFASFDGVTLTGAALTTSANAYIPDVRAEGVGVNSVLSAQSFRINKGRMWGAATAALIAFGPQRANGSIRTLMRRRSAPGNQVQGVFLRNQGGGGYNGYHLYWVEVSNVWRLTNGNTIALSGFADIADTFTVGEERIVNAKVTGTTITYTIINKATGAVIGTRTGTSALYATGWFGCRIFSGAISDENIGLTFENFATFDASQSVAAVVIDGPVNGNDQAQSTAFKICVFGAMPAQSEVNAALSGAGVVTPATPLVFAVEHASHPDVQMANFTVTPSGAGNRSVSAQSVHLRTPLPRAYFSISLDAPAFVAPFTARRGVLTKANAGGVDLNDLLLTQGFIADWTTIFTPIGASALASDWNNIGAGQTAFPTPAIGVTLTTLKNCSFTFMNSANPAQTITIPCSLIADMASVSRQQDIDASFGTASSSNIVMAGKTLEIARGSSAWSGSRMSISRHNSQLTSAAVLTVQNEADTFPAKINGLSGINNNRITFKNLKAFHENESIFVFTSSSTFSANDKSGFGLIIDGGTATGPVPLKQNIVGYNVAGSAGADPIVRNATAINIGSGFTIGTGNTAIRLASSLHENCRVIGYADNAFAPGATTGTCRLADILVERPIRDRRFGQDEANNTHLDAIQFQDYQQIYGRIEVERFIFALADGDAGTQGIFAGRVTSASSLFRNIIVLNASGAHAAKLPDPYVTYPNDNATVEYYTNLHPRRTYPNTAGTWLGSDRFYDENGNGFGLVGQLPSIGLSGLIANSTVRNGYAQKGGSTGAASATNIRSHLIPGGNTPDPIYAPSQCFAGWEDLLTYDWTSPKTSAERTQDVLNLLRPVVGGPLRNTDFTYSGAVINAGAGFGQWNDGLPHA